MKKTNTCIKNTKAILYILLCKVSEALVQVDFPVYAQAKSLFKSTQEKNGSFQKAVVKKRFFFCIKLLHANVQ